MGGNGKYISTVEFKRKMKISHQVTNRKQSHVDTTYI